MRMLNVIIDEVSVMQVVITAIQAVSCGEVTMQGANQRSNTAIWVEHNCHGEMEGSWLLGQKRSGDIEK